MKEKESIYSSDLPHVVAELKARVTYYRSMDLDYFEGPLKLVELEALLRWFDVSWPV